jgi:hypothetical protein
LRDDETVMRVHKQHEIDAASREPVERVDDE